MTGDNHVESYHRPRPTTTQGIMGPGIYQYRFAKAAPLPIRQIVLNTLQGYTVLSLDASA